jgi:putative ABC transport system substrate-binding protein
VLASVLAAVALGVLGALALVLRPWQAPPARPFTIGVLHLSPVDEVTVAGLKAGLRELGYREGQDVRFLYPGPAQTLDALDDMAEAQVRAGADLLFTASTPATLAAQGATLDGLIPVVFAPVNDPVTAGLVQCLREPGRRMTGIALSRCEPLRLHWLTRLVPGARRVLIPYNPDDRSALTSLAEVRQAAQRLGLVLEPVRLPSGQDAQRALAGALERADALFMPRDSSVEARIGTLVRLSLAAGLPLAAPSMAQVRAGALFGYGHEHFAFGRQAARLVDRIRRGVPPCGIPVETAKARLGINLATARAIGVEVSDHVLRQADLIVRE